MAAISNANLKAVLDKAARFSALMLGRDFTVLPNLGANAPNAGLSQATPLIASMSTLVNTTIDDAVFNQFVSNPVGFMNAQTLVMNGQLGGWWGAFFAGLDQYCASLGLANVFDLDSYLTSLNGALGSGASPVVRAHQDLLAMRRLSPQNAFIGANTDLATFAELGATTGTLTLLAVTGSATTGKLPPTVGGAQLVAINTTTLTAAPTIIVTAINAAGATVVFAASTLSTLTNGATNNLSDASQNYVAVTGITITGGTNANSFKITALSDRRIDNA